MRRARAPFALACAAATALFLAAIASCGARTGLPIGPEEDAGEDVFVITDHSLPPGEDAPPGIDTFQNDVAVINPCPDAQATLIYVMSEANVLYSFQPPNGPFSPIGTIHCPGSVGDPFSMAVDREGIAYVVFSTPDDDGGLEATGLFRVSTKSAECTRTKYDPRQNGNETFGMGFVANVGDAADGGETLFVSEDVGSVEDPESDGVLATIDTTTFVLTTVGPFSPMVPSAELTGTGGGRLFAFSPAMSDPSDSFIAQIDPQTAKVIGEDPTPGIVQGSGWAFGFWGGDFYTFTTPPSNATTVVNRFDPVAKTVTQIATAPANVTIVGAGVSTCAPQN
jgi:hypothetical protein